MIRFIFDLFFYRNKIYTYYVLEQLDNCFPRIIKINSKNKVSWDKIVSYYKDPDRCGFNFDKSKDSIELIKIEKTVNI